VATGQQRACGQWSHRNEAIVAEGNVTRRRSDECEAGDRYSTALYDAGLSRQLVCRSIRDTVLREWEKLKSVSGNAGGRKARTAHALINYNSNE
jgi:hypothetical protein